jgi:multidrug efflux pump subunit AcrA (membrane-fusion protein)
VTAPQGGVVRGVMVAAGQMVSSGTPLFEVINTDRVWVRVPVYVGDVKEIAADRAAMIGRLGATTKPAAGDTPVAAKPVDAPPSASAMTSTVDLFYELENAQGTFSPGQKVGATLTMGSEEQSLVVPWSAVTFDVNGGAWVYEMVGPRAYARRRVQVKHVSDGTAVLAEGPAAGTVLVTQGVAELFGKEMGFAK